MRDELLMQATGGVFSIDNLPESVSESIYFINSDPSYLPGMHWICVYFPKNSPAEFFDSLGHAPNYYSQKLSLFMKNTFIYNTRRLQAYNSNTCGLYCLFFLYYRIRGYSFSEILENFTPNLDINDKIVIDFYLKKVSNCKF